MNSTPTPPSAPSVGTAPKILKKKKRVAANPLVALRKPVPKLRTTTSTLPNEPQTNNAPKAALGQTLLKPLPGAATVASAPEEAYDDYPIVTTKRALLEGLRHHAMRFIPNSSATEVKVNPADESQFTRPVRLHRRDPRVTAAGRWGEVDGDSVDGKEVDDKERERIELARAERRAEREANQAQIAPASKTAVAQKKNNKQFQKKTEQVFRVNDTGDKVKNTQLRYEESIPWHLEDFENKNIWASSYESALSDCHIMLFPSQEPGNNTFKMVPVEKWYKFTQKSQFKALTIEEAEARMGKRVKEPRWFMETQKAVEKQKREDLERTGSARMFVRKGERGEKAVQPVRAVKKESGEDGEEANPDNNPDANPDMDDIDYDHEEAFADDEEADQGLVHDEVEEDAKDAAKKIKHERREANVFGLKENKDYDKEEEEKKQKTDAEKKLAKRIAKALMKREKNYNYEDDSEGNPYSSESESEDSEVERQKAEDAKKEEEKLAADKGKSAAVVQDKTGSDISTKGSNTPSGRPKHSDPLRKVLKRPGSPNLSEASGSESARKKKVKVQNPASGAATPTISRPTSPVNGAPPRKMTAKDVAERIVGGAGSDAEVSDNAARRVKKVKLRTGNGSTPASPNGTRASSPVVGSATSPLAEGAAGVKKRTVAQGPVGPLPSPAELRAAIPAEGISLTAILALFGNRAKNPNFLTLIKQNATFESATRTLYPKKVVEKQETPGRTP